MKVFVYGSGAREHALAWALSKGAEVFAFPGNPGISQCAQILQPRNSDAESIAEAVREVGVDFALIGPEAAIFDGFGEALRIRGVPTVAPTPEAAMLEKSKAFAKQAMRAAGVPTAEFETVTDAVCAMSVAERYLSDDGGAVLKVDGPALGKGVFVCRDQAQIDQAVGQLFGERSFGSAADQVIIERCLMGREASLISICSGGAVTSFPLAHDYKRAFDGDEGPNTGGMGSFAPSEVFGDDKKALAEDQVVNPILEEMARRGTPFSGVLFSGLLWQDGVPCCLEYNVRFGDPETQSLMMLAGDNFAEMLLAAARGEPVSSIETKPGFAVSVVCASEGYPGSIETGKEIEIEKLPEGCQVFHAGTKMVEGQLRTSGGRVITVSATGETLAQARSRAYLAADGVRFPGKRTRSDIAA
jgi:phosphoribosylamine--glycine ligase